MMNRKQKSKFNILRRNRGFAILCALGVLEQTDPEGRSMMFARTERAKPDTSDIGDI